TVVNDLAPVGVERPRRRCRSGVCGADLTGAWRASVGTAGDLHTVSMRRPHDAGMTTPDDARRSAIDRAVAALAAGDSDGAHAIYHDDAVLELPQSGE